MGELIIECPWMPLLVERENGSEDKMIDSLGRRECKEKRFEEVYRYGAFQTFLYD